MNSPRIIARVLALAAVLAAGCTDLSSVETIELTSQVKDWRDEVIYQVMIDRFANGDPNNDYNVYPDAPAAYHGGDYQGVIDHLDYFEALGVTTLWISPVVKNVEEDAGVGGYHGYWTQNFLEVNPHFGDLAKLRELVAACHERGIKVILDIVANHIGQLFYYDINRNGYPDVNVYGSGYRSGLNRVTEWDPDFDPNGVQSFMELDGQGNPRSSGPAPITWVWQPEINRVPPWPAEFANPEWYNRMGRVTVWGREKEACLEYGVISRAEYDSDTHWSALDACQAFVRRQEREGDFPGGLKDLKTTLPEVREALLDAYTYWIQAADFDGFRIDTVKHVEDDFWDYFCRGVRDFCDENGKENFLMFGEAFDGDDRLIGGYTKNDGLDSVFYFSQKYSAIDAVFKNGAATQAIGDLWRQRIPGLSDTPTAELHYGVTAKAQAVTGEDGEGLAPYELLVNFLDNHDVPRFLYEFDNRAALRQTLAFLFTIDGIPCIYYGTEQEFSGGLDPANREDLWESEYDTDGTTFRWIKELADLRRELAPLRRGTLRIVWESPRTGAERDAGIFAFERTLAGQTVLVVFNVRDDKDGETRAPDEEGGLAMVTSFASGTALRNRLGDADTNDQVTVGPNGTVRLTLGPRAVKVFTAK